MTQDHTRRFTDREVSLILRTASEIEEREGGAGAPESGGGLSLTDLRDIAREVGISPTAVDRAVERLGRPGSGSLLTGAPLTQKSVRAVPGELDRTGLSRLVGVVDREADDAGNVTEALGSVRWTSEDRFSSTQVALTPAGGQTRIQVVEKARPRLRRVVHFPPMAWGAMLGAPVAAALEPGAAGLAVIVAGAVVAGAAAGRLTWRILSGRAHARVERMGAALAQEAEAAVAAGQVVGALPPDETG